MPVTTFIGNMLSSRIHPVGVNLALQQYGEKSRSILIDDKMYVFFMCSLICQISTAKMDYTDGVIELIYTKNVYIFIEYHSLGIIRSCISES